MWQVWGWQYSIVGSRNPVLVCCSWYPLLARSYCPNEIEIALGPSGAAAALTITMMQRTQRIELRPWIPLLIAGVPALGYAVAYVHELGYCEAYNIPSYLIRLDLTTTLVAIAASLVGLAMLAWLSFAALSVPLYISATRRKIWISAIFFIFLFGLSLAYLTVEESKLMGIAFLVFLFFLFAGPWFFRRLPERRRRQDIPLVRLVTNKYFQYTLVVIYVVVLIFSFGYLAGRAAASQQEVFYVPSANPDLIVLKTYDGNIICGRLVQESDRVGLGPAISVLRMEDIPDLTLTPIRAEISFTLYPK